jgi:prolyl-tRNA synthetase
MKLLEAALLGFPWVIVVNNESSLDALEIKDRRTKTSQTLSLTQFLASEAAKPLPYY